MRTSVSLCICAFAHAVKSSLFLVFFARWVWQMESGSKWHGYKATPGGDGLVTATSVAIRTECVYGCAYACLCVCPTASRSVGTPWPVRSTVPTWILCEMRQKSRKTHQLEDAKEGRRRFRQLWNIFRLHSQNCLYFKSLLCPSILQEAFVTLGCFVFCVVFFSYHILVRIADEQTYHTSDVRWDKAEMF